MIWEKPGQWTAQQQKTHTKTQELMEELIEKKPGQWTAQQRKTHTKTQGRIKELIGNKPGQWNAQQQRTHTKIPIVEKWPGQQTALQKKTRTKRAAAVEKRPEVPQETNSCMESPRNPYTYTQEPSENAKAAELHPTLCGERQRCRIPPR